MFLVIGEKPSVSQALAKILKAEKKEDGYLAGEGCLVSWCFGHLAEYASPESYGEQYAKGIAGIGSMQSMTDEFNNEMTARNLSLFIGGKEREYLPHFVTINEYFARLNPEELQPKIVDKYPGGQDLIMNSSQEHMFCTREKFTLQN